MLSTPQPPSSTKQSLLSAAALCIWCLWDYCVNEVDPMAEKKADALLVAASVIASMNYQAALSQPGGAYQETKRYDNGTIEYEAGESIAASVSPSEYKRFSVANTVSFTFSMTTMFLLISGLSLKRRIFSFLLMASMFATITATTFSYKLALEATTPDRDEKKQGWIFQNHLLNGALITWFVVAGVTVVVFVGMQLKHKLIPAYRLAARRT